MKKNLTLRIDKALYDKWKNKINFSKFMEFSLKTLEGKDYYINIKTGKEEYV
jgi:hypothetical protein